MFNNVITAVLVSPDNTEINDLQLVKCADRVMNSFHQHTNLLVINKEHDELAEL